jgi:hypothetical protein
MADEFFSTFSEIVAVGARAQPVAEAAEPDADAEEHQSQGASRETDRDWGSPFTIGILVIAAILVIYFLVT